MKYSFLFLGMLTIIVAYTKETPQKQLTVNASPQVGGSVNPTSGSYAMGSNVKLTATPSSEYI
jgi:hypothetical protein